MDISLTHYLNLCYLLYCIFPMGLRINTNDSNINSSLFGWIRRSLNMLIPFYIFWGGVIPLQPVNILNAVFIIILSIILSLGIELLCYRFIDKNTEWKFLPDNKYNLIITLTVSVLEEVVFRGLAFQILLNYQVPLFIVWIITSFMYAYNHIFLGYKTIMYKFIWGLSFGLAMIMTNNIFVPIFAHIFSNLIIITLSNINKSEE